VTEFEGCPECGTELFVIRRVPGELELQCAQGHPVRTLAYLVPPPVPPPPVRTEHSVYAAHPHPAR
jgi:hypothetical protein